MTGSDIRSEQGPQRPVLAYLRSDAGLQNELESQRRALRAAARSQRWDLQWVQDVGHSGADLGRPGIQRALVVLRQGRARALVVDRLTTLSHSVLDLVDLFARAHDEGWAIVALTPRVDTSSDRGLRLEVMSCLAAMDGEAIASRRTSALSRHGADRGPTVPAEVARRIREARGRGKSLVVIANELNRDKVAGPGESPAWQPSLVWAVLREGA